ncbi:MAG: hypothetical protein ACYC6V_06690, partial [Bacillota bacterium]
MTETYLINERRWPRVVPVAQELRGDAVADVEGAVRAELAAISLGERVRPGTTVAITAGSRGFPYNI